MRRIVVVIENSWSRAIIKADPLKTTGEDTEEVNVNHLAVVRHLHQSGRWRKIGKAWQMGATQAERKKLPL